MAYATESDEIISTIRPKLELVEWTLFLSLLNQKTRKPRTKVVKRSFHWVGGIILNREDPENNFNREGLENFRSVASTQASSNSPLKQSANQRGRSAKRKTQDSNNELLLTMVNFKKASIEQKAELHKLDLASRESDRKHELEQREKDRQLELEKSKLELEQRDKDRQLREKEITLQYQQMQKFMEALLQKKE